MPPLRGSAKHFSPAALESLASAGNGRRVIVAARSYDAPSHADPEVDSLCDSSVSAVLYLAKLLPIRNNLVVCMAGEPETPRTAELDFLTLNGQSFQDDDGETVTLTVQPTVKKAEDGSEDFYTIANDPNCRTTVVRTNDDRFGACATFVIGNAQKVQ